MRDVIYQSSNYKILGSNGNSGDQEIIKVIQDGYSDKSLLNQISNEYKITQNLDILGVRKALKIDKFEGREAIWLNYVSGIHLNEAFQKVDPQDFLDLAIQITNILQKVHSENIIHQDLSPNNILFDPITSKVNIIDFGISTKYDVTVDYQNNPDKLKGNLRYIAPEQTGRMNRVIDFRSDIYSLGATFYELITGQVPFDFEDPMDLIYAHIATKPKNIQELRPEFPSAIEKIVMKMLKKNAENRYKSITGLLNDLLDLKALTNNELAALKEFVPGQKDFSHKLQVPQKLYGREKEITLLMDASEKMIGGKKNMLLIGGKSGTGKSFLVHEVHKKLTSVKGVFLEGKFDQYQKNIPYYAWIRAFEGFVKNILTSDSNTLANWQEKISKTLGKNGKILTDLIPSLELIIGEQKPVKELNGIEAQNRFRYVFEQFLSIICTEEQPAVIFLDDLQWADLASLNLLKSIASNDVNNHLLIICAYRDNEVDENHPFMTTTRSLEDEKIEIGKIKLDNLSLKHISLLTEETTRREEGVEELAQLIHSKTNGNAFFVNQFIYSLFEKKLLKSDPELKSGHPWVWDIDEIKRQNITSNVVDLMIAKVKDLPENTQGHIRSMSCVGNKVPKEVLNILLEQDNEKTYQTIEQAMVEGLVTETEDSYKFVHDKIQQAVYSLLEEKERKETHLKIATLFNKNRRSSNITVFDIINQYLNSIDLVTEENQKVEIANLALEAGVQAKESSAYSSAKKYLEAAKDLYGENVWVSDYDIARQLNTELANIEYLLTEFEASQKYVTNLLEHIKTPIEKAEVYNMLIIQDTFQSDYDAAIKKGIQALSFLDTELPTENLQEVLGGEVEKMMGKIGNRPIDSLINEPLMTDPEKIITTELLVNLIPTAYLSGQMELYAVISAKIINLALEHGHSEMSSHGYSNYGGVIAAVMGQYQAAHQFGQLALNLTEKFDNMYLKCKDSMLFANFMLPWVKHINESEIINITGFQLGLESGELQYPGYISMFLVMEAIYKGEHLSKVKEEADRFIEFTNKTKHVWVNDGILSMKHGILNLLGKTKGIDSFSTNEFNEFDHINECKERMSINGVAYYLIMKGQTAFLNGDSKAAVQVLESATEAIPAIAGMIFTSTYNFYYSLALLTSSPTKEQIEIVKQNQEQMKIWSENCPENFYHKLLIVDAQLSFVEGKQLKAIDKFKKAIVECKKQSFVQNEGIANELLAALWTSIGYPEYAQMHLDAAIACYTFWGAESKVEILKKNTLQKAQTKTLTQTMTSTGDFSIDSGTVVKAIKLISSSIKIEELLDKMAKISAQNAGAEKTVIMLPYEGGWKISAIYTTKQDELLMQDQLEGLQKEAEVPMSIINYAHRTQEEVLLYEATADDRFGDDKYVKDNMVSSVICLPMIHLGRCCALMYLENNLTSGAFYKDQLQILKFLSVQMAISIDNAMLYASMEEKVKERTGQLKEAYDELKIAQNQIIQSEKMAALGSLVAGVTHEINTPLGVIHGGLSNIDELINYQVTEFPKLSATMTKKQLDFIESSLTLQNKQNLTTRDERRIRKEIERKLEEMGVKSGSFLAEDIVKLNLHEEIESISTLLKAKNGIEVIHAAAKTGSLHNNIFNMNKAVAKMQKIIFALKSYSHQKNTEEMSTVNVIDGLETVLTLYFNELKKGIEIDKNYSKATINIQGYTDQLDQIWTNLINNAIHAMTDGGTLSINAHEEGSYAVIEIQDTGAGIPQEIQNKVFNPFYTTKAQGEGTGLGLNISKKIIESHGGTIDFSSQPGHTIFTIKFPLT